MISFQEQNYTINVYTDILEWAKEFYGMEDGWILSNQDEVSKECMGFAEINSKTISIFVANNSLDLGEVVAHEIGHIYEIDYNKNPAQTTENDKIHEEKANSFMNFYILVNRIIEKIKKIKI